MNIFVIDIDPFIAAKNLCDAHVVKMIVETCQLLSTQDRLNGITVGRYKIAYRNHPCRKCLDNQFNYIWLQYHLYGLLKEYTYRYGKIHKCQEMYDKYWKRLDDKYLYERKGITFTENYAELVDCTSFPQCVLEEMKIKNDFGNDSTDIVDVIKAYRNYYRYKEKTLKRFSFKRSFK